MNIKEIKEQIKNDKKIDLRKTIENNIYNSLSEGHSIQMCRYTFKRNRK